MGGAINPAPDSVYGDELWRRHEGRAITNVEFDVGLTTEESDGASTGIGVYLGNIGIGTRAKADSSSMVTSRIRFSVPIVIPSTHPQKSGDESEQDH